ncbi:hypothetical protein MHC_01575 [Mycoplasma haemocanis str. Illinois]|uniref:Uncharacterized protein n=1 Tax=Mycoplasma haemocanis (strain Illinois) TaxID=1111676 RepID=H6N6A9_MYCHN|nr:hypothetical protein [Mycoplasma haemocanis]AEW45181.1 hypothetical protein MHC_01575 [Mycoplasma haemocanis str. Illinois]
MTKLPFFGSIAAIGGVGGLAWESSKTLRQKDIISKTTKPLAMKRCEIYSIVSTPQNTVKKESENTFRPKVTNPSHWERMDKECRVKDKIYVANRGGNWVYDENDQKDAWKVID